MADSSTCRSPRYPSLYQVNTRVWLTALSSGLKRQATLDDIPDTELDRIKALGFDWVWLLSVWQLGKIGQEISRSNTDWQREFEQTLPDLQTADIGGSGFAITAYEVSPTLGGAEALARLRSRLQARNLKLMLDFVPNHTAIDNPWVSAHPECYISGTEEELKRNAQNYIKLPDGRILAHGRDPYFPGWPDTLQLNYANDATQKVMTETLIKIATQCDGVRCDMAMLLLPDVFERTWSARPKSFWDQAIATVRKSSPKFCFMAECYWDLEWTLQQLGFDYTYDKRLYDRLRAHDTNGIRGHLCADIEYQNRLARFLENHDEPRAAATFPPDVEKAAAVITFLIPGLRFFHQGQLEGKTQKISPHLIRGPLETPDQALAEFYNKLLKTLQLPTLRDGNWRLLDCVPAWQNNPTSTNYIAFAWDGSNAERLLIAVNYSGSQSQCHVDLADGGLAGKQWQLEDLLSGTTYVREGVQLTSPGLYLDETPWKAQVFRLSELKH